MEARVLPRDRLWAWLGALIARYEVIAPRDDLSYGPIRSPDRVDLTRRPVRSPKEFFLPQRQVLLSYRRLGREIEVAPPSVVQTARVLWGARPCDAAALPVMDRVFGWDEDDELYAGLRQETTVVSVACERIDEACFCASLGGSPAGIEGADLLLTPVCSVYHIQIVTERGMRLVEADSAYFEPSDPWINRERARVEDELLERVPKSVDLEGIEAALDPHAAVWGAVAQTCVDCGICTFLCPTCHCFGAADEGVRGCGGDDPAGEERGERVRYWDACVFDSYARTRARHHRPTHSMRYRQRIMHKFAYYPRNLGKILCVGCGRCIEYCPVSIDLTQVLRSVRGDARR